MDFKQPCVISFVLLISVINNAYSQNNREQLKSFLKEDRRKDLIKQFEPSYSPHKTNAVSNFHKEKTTISDEDVARYYYKYKTGMFPEQTADSVKFNLYITKEAIYRIKGNERSLKADPVRTVYDIDPNAPRAKVGISGNLSGWNPKKLSKKAQNILVNVLGMEVDPRDCE